MDSVKKVFPFISFLLALLFTYSDAKAILRNKDSLPRPDFEQYLSGKPKNTIGCPDFGDLNSRPITVGIRTGICTLFDPGSIGYGLGVDMRIRMDVHWNLELYGDEFKTNIMKLGYRHALCFGASVLYYWIEHPLRKHKFTPFLLGGLSLDDNKLYSYEVFTPQFVFESWGPWVNLGYGMDYNITSLLDVSLEGYYSVALSTHPIALLVPNGDLEYMIVHTQSGFHPGGLFIILSLNYTIK